MTTLDWYLENCDEHIMTEEDSRQGKYIDTPMSKTELNKYQEIKPMFEELIALKNEINEKAMRLYGNDKTFNIMCVIDEPYRQ